MTLNVAAPWDGVGVAADDVHRLEESGRDVQAAADIADVVAMTTANRRFHFALIEACALPRLVRLIRLLWDATEVYRCVYDNDEQNRELVAAERQAVVAAVRAGDAAAALVVLTEHREQPSRPCVRPWNWSTMARRRHSAEDAQLKALSPVRAWPMTRVCTSDVPS